MDLILIKHEENEVDLFYNGQQKKYNFTDALVKNNKYILKDTSRAESIYITVPLDNTTVIEIGSSLIP